MRTPRLGNANDEEFQMGFAPDGAGWICRCPGLVAHEQRTRVAAITLTIRASGHADRMATVAGQVKAVKHLARRSVHQRPLQAECDAMGMVGRDRHGQPRRAGDCGADQADRGAPAGQDDAVVMNVAAELG